MVATQPIDFLGTQTESRGSIGDREVLRLWGLCQEGESGGHYDRVHPKRSGSVNAESKTVTYSGQRSVFRKSHRRRNLLALCLIGLAVIVVAFPTDIYSMRVISMPRLYLTLNGSPFTVPADIR